MSILDLSLTVAPPDVDRLARLVARLTAAPVAIAMIEGPDGTAVGRFEADPADLSARVIVSSPLTSAIGVTLCTTIARAGERRVSGDARVEHPESGVAAYVGVPVVAGDGTVVGAVCVLDFEPRVWTPEQVADLADLVAAAAVPVAPVRTESPEPRPYAEIARENAFLGAVLEHLTDGVAACDAQGTLVFFNPALQAIHGLPARTISRDEWAKAYDLYDADGERLLGSDEIPLARAFAGEQVRQQHMVVRNAHGERHFRASGSPIFDTAGHKLGAVVLMHDTTSERRRRHVRSEHLAVATELAQDPNHAEGVAAALSHLRSALGATTTDLVRVQGQREFDIDDRVVSRVARSGATVQAVLDAPFVGHVVCTPITVGDQVHSVLYVAGASDDLLDDLAATTVEGVAALTSQWLERRRAAQAYRDLGLAQHEVKRLSGLTDAFVWSAEILPSGFSQLQTTTSAATVLGGDDLPGPDEWLAIVSQRTPEADRPALLAWHERIMQGRPAQLESRLLGYDGRMRRIRTSAQIRSEGGHRYLDGLSELLEVE